MSGRLSRLPQWPCYACTANVLRLRPVPSPPMNLPAARSHRFKFLVVDDDPVVLAVMKERLNRMGYDVTVRQDALGTTQWVGTHQPDFVLLDISMPALSGGELTHLIKQRSRTRRVGVILFSSLPRDEVEEQVRSSGAVGGLSKQLTEEEFQWELERLMSKHAGALNSLPPDGNDR